MIDIWRMSLTAPAASRNRLAGLLCEQERRRADRFAFDRDRDRFVMAHGRLRSILSQYARVPGRQLEFLSAPGGKPRLVSPGELRFNLSHSGDRALVAVAWAREVGVDVEAVRVLEDLDDLAASCFSASERGALDAVPEASRLECFFDGWTRKEAFLKLLGDGLSRPLDSFDVTLTPGEPVRLLRVEGGRAGDWTLHSIDVGPGFRAALAVEGQARTIRLLDWPADGETGRSDGRRGTGRHEEVPGGRQPGGTVLDLAGRPSSAERLAGRWQGRDEERVPGLGQGGLDRHDAGEPAGRPVREGLTFEASRTAGARP